MAWFNMLYVSFSAFHKEKYCARMVALGPWLDGDM